MNDKKVLISGAGIAGLTLGILLKEKGWNPVLIERDSVMRKEGYMMDFFGTGWDVAERMGLLEELLKIHYPILNMQFVDKEGKPYHSLSIKHIKNAFNEKYTYLRRSDLEMVLWKRAEAAGLTIRFGTSIRSLENTADEVNVEFENGERDTFALVFGADGAHSRVRELVFGSESAYERYMGYYVAAFHLENHSYEIGSQFKIYEEPDRALWIYPLGEGSLDAVYVFRNEDIGRIPPDQRLSFLQKKYEGAGWIARSILDDVASTEPVYFDSVRAAS